MNLDANPNVHAVGLMMDAMHAIKNRLRGDAAQHADEITHLCMLHCYDFALRVSEAADRLMASGMLGKDQ